MDEFINRLDDMWLDDDTIVKLYSNYAGNRFAVEVVYTDIDDNDWEEFDNLDDAIDKYDSVLNETEEHDPSYLKRRFRQNFYNHLHNKIPRKYLKDRFK